MVRLYDYISYTTVRIAPRKIVEHIDSLLRYGGLKQEAKVWLGSVLFFSWLVAVAVLLGFWILLEVTDPLLLVLSGIAALVLVFFTFYFLLYIKVEDRRKRAERVLPDMLQMVAANIRAGVTPIVALRMAARPEFGPLEEEIKFATTKALGAESFADALIDIGTRIRSEILERTIGLFTSSMRSGGNLAALLENTANEILEAQELRRELIAGTNMYIVFILFTMIIGMPMLLSISIQFVAMVESLRAENTGGTFAQELGVAVAAPVSANFIERAAIVSLLVTSVLVSMLIGVIHDGSEWYGLRYAPLFAISSLVVFFAFRLYILRALLPI